MPDILIVDDDKGLCELLSEYLKREGFAVRIAHNGTDGLHTATRSCPDIIVCDIMMPGLNGLQLLLELRKGSSVPVLILSAKRSETERIAGLDLGADDYLPKPFSPRELVARIRAILRRSPTPMEPTDPAGGRVLSVGDLTMDRSRQLVTVDDRRIKLTATEIDLLGWLLERSGETVDRRFLSQRALGREPSPEDRGLDMMISRIRRKLGPHADGRARIQSIRSLGYAYVLP